MSEVHIREQSQDIIKLPKAKTIIKHPGYPDELGQNDLLTFYAWDTEEGGFHASTAHLACSLVACNAFDGYLTKDKCGSQRINCDGDKILSPGHYYFHVPNPPDQPPNSKYPVYPTFSNWKFPHEMIPDDWKSNPADANDNSTKSVSAISAAVIERDKSCIVSGDRDMLERAHLCPKVETEWFQTNGMRSYNNQGNLFGSAAADDMANAITLRMDIHKAFDRGHFVIARKKGHWVPHFLNPTYDLGRKYHQLVLKMNANVASEFLLVRFAWAIFPLVRSLFEHGGERIVKLRQKTNTGGEEVQKVISKEDVADLFEKGSSRGRSKTPKKRKSDADTTVEECHSVKRQRCGQESLAACCSSNDAPGPELSYNDDSDKRLSESREVKSLQPPQFFDAEDERLWWMKRRALLRQRPDDQSLMCCDYSAAEDAIARGIPGPPEYGESQFCERCLGLEFQDDLNDA